MCDAFSILSVLRLILSVFSMGMMIMMLLKLLMMIMMMMMMMMGVMIDIRLLLGLDSRMPPALQAGKYSLLVQAIEPGGLLGQPRSELC